MKKLHGNYSQRVLTLQPLDELPMPIHMLPLHMRFERSTYEETTEEPQKTTDEENGW